MSNVLGLSDQLFIVFEQATGTNALLRGVLVYDRAIDIERLRRSHLHLRRGR